ncbi:MAG: cysteine--tRNA ligase [Chloroflexi bacterium]|nr:cysteine--tRNA ligase [Chloroflexota bacterium]
MLKLTDTLTSQKRDFVPLEATVRMYVCGPNLYGPCHVGHALSYIVFDVLRRYLEYRGHQILHIQNFTDIEDRIIELSKSEGRTIGDISEHYIKRFTEEMAGLNVLPAHEYPRATAYIPQMIRIVQELIEKGLAYPVEGDVYFRVRAFPGYGKLSKRSLEEMQAGSRIEVDPRKEDPMDFALWKTSKEGEPAWPSPWGMGRPGWHIECSAMSLSLLGEQFDIHGGGHDVIFPHHENEIAQSEGYTGRAPVVGYWVHNGLLKRAETDEEKMTRHSGNFVSLRDALAQHSSDAIRLFLLSAHYRSPRAYSEEEIQNYERAAERMRPALEPSAGQRASHIDSGALRARFEAAMDDDLNTPQAMAVLFDLVREINRGKERGEAVSEAQALLRELGSVLGLTFQGVNATDDTLAQPFVDLLVELRADLRKAKQFALADSIRDRLNKLGVILEDTPQGTKWRMG